MLYNFKTYGANKETKNKTTTKSVNSSLEKGLYNFKTYGAGNIQAPIAPVPEIPTLGQKIKKGAVGFIKGAVKPVATMVARPIQLGAELLGASDENVNQFTKDKFGDWIAPTPQNIIAPQTKPNETLAGRLWRGDLTKDVGRSIGTASMELPLGKILNKVGGRFLGSATKLTPSALARNKTLGTVAVDSLAGGVFGLGMSAEQGSSGVDTLKNLGIGMGLSATAPFLLKGGAKLFGKSTPTVEEQIAKFNTQEVAPKIPEVPTTEFTHYSKVPDLTELDPNKFGTGFPSEELRRSQSFANEFQPRINVYTTQPQIEKNIIDLPYKYTGKVEGNLLKYGTTEFDNILNEAKAKIANPETGFTGTPGAIITKFEKMAKDSGYVGIEYPEQGTILFNPTKVEKQIEQIHSLLSEANISKLPEKNNWGIITATKESLGGADHPLNKIANQQLKDELIDIYGKQNVVTVLGKYNGIDQGDSFFVNGATEQELINLGRKYEQESILNRRGFVYTDNSGVSPMKGKVLVGDEALKQPGYSIINKKPISFDIDWENKIPNNVEEVPKTGQVKTPIKKTFTEEEFKQKEKLLDEDPKLKGSNNAYKIQKFDELKQTKSTDELIDMAVGKTESPKDLPQTAIYKLMKQEKNLTLKQIERLKNTNVASQAGADLQATQITRKAFIDNPTDIITLTEKELKNKALKDGITKNTIKKFLDDASCTM